MLPNSDRCHHLLGKAQRYCIYIMSMVYVCRFLIHQSCFSVVDSGFQILPIERTARECRFDMSSIGGVVAGEFRWYSKDGRTHASPFRIPSFLSFGYMTVC